MNVVLYLRYSSDKQTEQSIEGQDRVCSAFCKSNNYKIVGKYIDRATSASKDTEKRLEFLQMVKDSERKQFEAVIVYKLDRFARNRYDSAVYKNKLKKNGVRVISATEIISENPEGIILESVLEGMAEFYTMELSQKVKRGMNETALKCNSTGGTIPLGYKIVDKKFVIDEDNAEIVRQAFTLYAEGHNIAEICRLFNERGYRTSRGSEFTYNSFNKMLRNERYIGIYTYNGLRIVGGVPAILDADLFNAVQDILDNRPKNSKRGKAKVDYLLAGKLFCGHCGSTMTGECGRSVNGKTYHYYSCPKHRRRKGCDKKPISKEYLEQIVIDDVMQLFTPARIDALADAAIKANREDIENDELIPRLEAQLKDLSSRIDNLLNLAEHAPQSESVADRITELEKEKRDVKKRLASRKAEYIVLERDQVVTFLTQFARGDRNDPVYQRTVIDLLVNSVTIWDEPDGYKITTIYNITSDNAKTVHIKNGDMFGSSELRFTTVKLAELFYLKEKFVQTKKHRI